ncbi:unnamed protein product [Boreogadus saida]
MTRARMRHKQTEKRICPCSKQTADTLIQPLDMEAPSRKLSASSPKPCPVDGVLRPDEPDATEMNNAPEQTLAPRAVRTQPQEGSRNGLEERTERSEQ